MKRFARILALTLAYLLASVGIIWIVCEILALLGRVL